MDAAAWTGEPDTNEDTPERGPADLNTLSLTQQLTQMGVAGAPAAGSGQVYGLVITLVRHGIGRPSPLGCRE